MALILLLATFAHAQDSQFFFDPNGNLFLQTAATTAPPQIIGQPQNRIAAPGESASFFVVAADTRGLSYQWRFNGADIGGATNDALLLQNVSTNNEGEYRVVLTNPSGSVTSAPALLMIDSDADGLPDSWERTFFANLNQNATADFDGDGISNRAEFFDNTNPTNRISARFRLTVFTDGDGVVELSPTQPSYTNGQSVTLTATPFGTNLFYGWTGDTRTTNNPLVLTMTTNKTVHAHFHFLPLDIVWTNTLGGDWHSPTNWNPNLVPGALDNAIIPVTATVTVSSPAECLGLTLGSASGSPTLTGSGTLTVYGSFLWMLGTMSGTGRTILDTNGTLNISAAVTLNTCTLENRGAILVFNVGSLLVAGGSVVTNCAGALFQVVNESATLGGGLANGRFDNAGTFRKSSGTGTLTVSSGISFNNSGILDIQTGTLLCGGGFTDSGTVDVSAGATLRLTAGGSATGAFTAQPAALVEWTGGTFTLNAGAQLNGAGLYRINGSSTVTANASFAVSNLDLTAGTLDGAGVVTIGNAMNWMGGAMSGGGRLIIPAGVTLAIPTFVSLNTRTLENHGTILLTSTGGFSVTGGGVITNCVEASFDVLNDTASIGGGIANGRLDNVGTFRKSGGTGTSTVVSGLSFNNFGTVQVQTGTLSLGGGGTHSGSFTLPAGTMLNLSGGTHTADGISSITGAGQLTVSGGTANLAGLVNVSGSNTFSGGTANLIGNYICMNNTLTISGGTANFNGTGTVTPAVILLSNGALSGSNTVTIGSAMNWTGGSMSGGGRTVISPGATLGIPTSIGVTLNGGRTLENGGSALFNGTSILSVFGGAVITNRPGASFNVENELAGGGLGGGIANGRIDNAGAFRKSAGLGTTTIASGLTLNNFGAVEIQTGTLLCSGTFNNSGAVNLSPGTTNRIAGGGSAIGAFTASATALVEWTAGTFTLNPGAQLSGAGLYRFNGGSVTANANLTLENLDLVSGSSTLGGTGTVAVASAMNWTAGTMSGSGRTIIPIGATLQVGSASGVSLQRTLENGGSALWTGAGSIILLNGVITNRAGGLFHAQNAAAFFFGGGTCRFDHSGTFRKSANTGTTTVPSGVSFTNSGMVDIRSGILAANGGYVSSSNALLKCALGGTTAGTGYGQLQVGGAVTLNGALSVDLINGFVPATNDSFTVLTAGTRSGAFASFSYPSNAVTMQLSNTPNSVIVRVGGLVVPELVLFPPVFTGSNVMLCWIAVSNKTYRLEFNVDLGLTNWDAVPGDVTTVSNNACKLDVLTSSNRFYRVRIVP